MSAEIEALREENRVLRDLLESQYRAVDAARLESEKADDEALHWKTRHAKAMSENWRANYDVMKQWEKRALEAEARLEGRAVDPMRFGSQP